MQSTVNQSASAQAASANTISTWLKDQAQDLEMGDYHLPFWQSLIAKVKETDLSDKTVLDFGCGVGGFLRHLYSERPFKQGIGLDIAADSVAIANQKKGPLPIQYLLNNSDLKLPGTVDVAFSYEVIYLLKDLAAHAEFMKSLLKPGGAYYAATGCHTQNPQWHVWRDLIESKSSLTPCDYSLEQISDTFRNAGFSCSAQRLEHNGFVPIGVYPDYFPTVMDTINYYWNDVVILRFQAP